MSRIPTLDGVRGFAALIVMVSHFSNETGVFGGVLGQGAGQIGVMLFFVLSGFLMGHLYVDTALARDAILTFFRNRFARVAPLYLLLVVASFGLTVSIGQQWPLYPVDGDNLISHLLFAKGESVLWTVAVEMQFYALFVVIWFAASKSRQTLIIAILFYVAILSLADYPNEPRLLQSLPFFAAGILVHYWRPTQELRYANVLFVVFLCLLIASYPRLIGPLKFQLGLASLTTEYPIVWEQTAYLLIVPAFLWLSIAAPWAQKTLGGIAARYLGTISYSLYLLHMPVLYTLGAVPGMKENTALYFTFFLLVTIIFSVVSRKLVERPLEKLIRYGSFSPSHPHPNQS